MGLGMHEEFMRLTPMKTSPASGSQITLKSDAKSPELCPPKDPHFDDEECRTPESASSLLTPPPICPPAPLKPRRPRRKLAPASVCFYEVPEDLASVFVSVAGCNKKLGTC